MFSVVCLYLYSTDPNQCLYDNICLIYWSIICLNSDFSLNDFFSLRDFFRLLSHFVKFVFFLLSYFFLHFSIFINIFLHLSHSLSFSLLRSEHFLYVRYHTSTINQWQLNNTIFNILADIMCTQCHLATTMNDSLSIFI